MTPLHSESRDAALERRAAGYAAALDKERAISAALIDAAGNMVMVVDAEGRITRFNQSCEYTTGYSAAEVQGRPFWELFLAPERGEQVKAAFIPDQGQAPVYSFDNYWATRDGGKRLIAWSLSVLRDETGTPESIIGVGNDLTARKETEEAFAQLTYQNDLILAAVGDGIFGIDRSGCMTFANPAAATMLGHVAQDLIGQPVHHFLRPVVTDEQTVRRTDHLMFTTLAGGSVHRATDEEFGRKDGASFPVEYVSTPINKDGEIIGAVVVFRDITERKRAEKALQHQALHDALTGLPNRTLLHDRLKQALHAARRGAQPLALLLLDLDRFKEINDTLGHHHGDLLLEQVGRRLAQGIRAADTVARLGGDEFAILLPATDALAAIEIADRLLAALDVPFVVEGQYLGVGASIGIALCPTHSAEGHTLLRQADVAMYAAKRSQRGHMIYEPEHDQHSPERLSLMSALRQAIEREQLLLYYQPKIDLATDEVLGVECLVRWQHPEFGLITPDRFIPMAEHTGMIGSLTLCVLEAALRQCRAWCLAGLELSVAVNLSMWNLHDPDLAETIQRLLNRYRVPPSLLRLELTESTVMSDTAHTLSMLKQLSTLGIRLSVDDFGTGYSSLAYLKQLPVDEIKIDKTFVAQLANSAADAAIVSATIGLGHSLGLQVVAEGVETREAAEMLAAIGCDVIQGYFYSRPLPAAQLEEWLQSYQPACL